MRTYTALMLACLWILAGCNSSEEAFAPDTFSKEDMCVVSVSGENKICYGQPRSEIEEDLGVGTEDDLGAIDYEHGISVFYREDRAAAIMLEESSAARYETVRGAAVGQRKEDIKQMYGEEHAQEIGMLNLDYFYDTAEKRLIQYENLQASMQEAVNYYVLTCLTDDAGTVRRIMLMDLRYAQFIQ